MTESFFDRLELELRTAAERPPRRLAGRAPGARGVAIGLVAAAAIAVALIPAAALLGGGGDGRVGTSPTERAEPLPVGTVIPDGHGIPPRDGDHTVVATGTAPVFGRWQMEVSRSSSLKDPETGEEYQPAGLRCLSLFLLDPPPNGPGGGGQCGEFPRTPGFSRLQEATPNLVGATVKEVLVFGRTPDAAAKVVLTADGGIRKEVEPFPGPEGVEGGFYLIQVKPRMEHARVNWLDRDGNEGSRGIELLPPASGHVKR